MPVRPSSENTDDPLPKRRRLEVEDGKDDEEMSYEPTEVGGMSKRASWRPLMRKTRSCSRTSLKRQRKCLRSSEVATEALKNLIGSRLTATRASQR